MDQKEIKITLSAEAYRKLRNSVRVRHMMNGLSGPADIFLGIVVAHLEDETRDIEIKDFAEW